MNRFMDNESTSSTASFPEEENLLHSSLDSSPSENNDDDAKLKKMGYVQELHRGFSGLMSFSFCFTAVAGKY